MSTLDAISGLLLHLIRQCGNNETNIYICKKQQQQQQQQPEEMIERMSRQKFEALEVIFFPDTENVRVILVVVL
jgi:hypothetical protein